MVKERWKRAESRGWPGRQWNFESVEFEEEHKTRIYSLDSGLLIQPWPPAIPSAERCNTRDESNPATLYS